MPAAKKKRRKTAPQTGKSEEKTNAKPPSYGTINYWNRRYQAVLGDTRLTDDILEDEGAPLAFHEWYFTYDELRPLLLPLIFGPESHLFLEECGDQTIEEATDDRRKACANGAEIVHNSNGKDESAKHDETSDNGTVEEVDRSENHTDSSDYDESDHDEDSATIDRPGLIGDTPITILEVGCGDCPLGAALATEVWNAIQKLPPSGLLSFSTSFKDIICSDYSSVVIDIMKKQYIAVLSGNVQKDRPQVSTLDKKPANVGNLPLRFEQFDATALPLASNSIELVLEKGTIDAVLSDVKTGVQNATQIMSECARVVSIGGYVVLISHLNAHFPPGLAWLEDVIFPGLKNGDASCNWEIEVHGKGSVTESEDEDDQSGNDDGTRSDATGPAVYIISKLLPPVGRKKKETIPMRFLSY